MTSVTNNCPGLHERYRYSGAYNYASSTTVTREDTDGSRSTLHVSLNSSYEYRQSLYTPSTYEAPSHCNNPANSKVTESQNPIDNESASEDIVLRFIEQQLSADLENGSNTDELQERLNHGFQGFLEGYNDGVSLLESMGLFEGAVKDSVEQMFKQVLLGFKEIAEKFALENPVPQSDRPASEISLPESVSNTTGSLATGPQTVFEEFLENLPAQNDADLLDTLLHQNQNFYAKLEAESSATNLYSFRLRTADGDMVSIRSFSGSAAQYQAEVSASGVSEHFSLANMDNFHFSVKGELDAEELSAITDLLSQLNDIAETFFAGDIFSAYEQALEVGFNSNEIARFSLNLQQTTYTKLNNTYGEVARTEETNPHKLDLRAQEKQPWELPISNKLSQLSEFIRMIENLRKDGERFQFRPHHMGDFAQFLAHRKFGEHPLHDKFGPAVSQIAQALENSAT